MCTAQIDNVLVVCVLLRYTGGAGSVCTAQIDREVLVVCVLLR